MKSCIALILFHIWASPAFPDTFNKQVHEEFYNVLNALRQRAVASSDQSVARLLEHPTVSIDWESKLPGASALHGSGNVSIQVTAEMIKLLFFFAELSTLTLPTSPFEPEKIFKCKYEYQRHIRNQIFQVFNGRVPSGEYSTYDSPEEYATLMGYHCQGIETAFPMSEDLKQHRDMLVRNAIGFIVMHEVAHAIIGHRISPRSNEVRQAILCASRRQESEADEFAVRRLVRYGFPEAVSSNSYWDLGLSVGSIFPADEAASTHPSPSRRMGDSINLSIEEARRLGANPDPRLVDLAQQLLGVQVRIERQLASDKLRVRKHGC